MAAAAGRTAPIGVASPGAWSVVLPFTRPLSLNDRQHWRVKAKQVAQWRQAAADALTEAGVPRLRRARVTLQYIPKDKRRRDPDNLVAAYKPCVDSLMDAGVVQDDTLDYVDRVWPVILPPDPKREGGRFVLQIEEC
jgi:crossover junction endodeoxyribonuclease RusA